MRPFTLHIRLTNSCNADCSYCSSFDESGAKRMSVEELRSSIRFIFEKQVALGIRYDHITVEYVGGEITLIPMAELKEMVEFVREFYHSKGVVVRDGVQSNLICSPRKLDFLRELFGSRIGTSVDHFTEQRTIKGDHAKYDLIFKTSDQYMQASNSHAVPAVLTIDDKNYDKVGEEVGLAIKDGRNLTIRPVFLAGLNEERSLLENITEAHLKAFDAWFMKTDIIVEPLYSLLKKRVGAAGKLWTNSDSFCAFQHDCANKSLSLQPDGSLYVCQEMGDGGHYVLGNAVKGEWNTENYRLLRRRSVKLSRDCIECPYYEACQGGCMMQSVTEGRGIFGKTEYCATWKALFSVMDQGISSYGRSAVANWITELDECHEAT